LGDWCGGAGGHVCRKRIVGGFLVPKDREHPPTLAVVEHLHAVDAANERLFLFGFAGFVAGEDLGDIAEALDFVDDGGFEERVRVEIVAAALDEIFNGHEADGGAVGIFHGAGEAGFGDEERAEAVPVARSWRAGDYVVDGGHQVIDGVDVGGFC